jgi:sec-independent protein translocase protein TatB
MFDFNWSEIALIGVVALVLIGPKDMPVAIRAISNAIKKMRRMAGEFQHHVDDMLRDADLAEVKSSFDEIRGMNLKGAVRRTLDPDGTLHRAFDDPFTAHPVKPVMTAEPPPPAIAAPEAVPPEAPSFIPPGAARPPEAG